MSAATAVSEPVLSSAAGTLSPGRAWACVGAITVSTFAMVTTELMPVGLLTEVAGSLKVSDGHAGFMVTTPGTIAALTAPFMAVGLGRLDRRHVLYTLGALLLLSNVVAAWAVNFPMLILGRAILGISVGGFWSFAVDIGRRLVAEKHQSRAVAIILAGISAGAVCGVPVGSYIGSVAGWRWAFAATAGLSVVALSGLFFLLPKIPAHRSLTPADLIRPLGLAVARVGLVATVLLFIGYFATYTYLEPLLLTVFQLSRNAVTALLLVYGVAGILGTFLGEVLVKRDPRTTLFGVTLILSALLFAIPHCGTGLGPATVVALLWGTLFGIIPLAITVWMLNATPDSPEAGQTVLVCASQLSIGMGTVVGGLLVDHVGLSRTMLVGGLFTLVAAAVIFAGRSLQNSVRTG